MAFLVSGLAEESSDLRIEAQELTPEFLRGISVPDGGVYTADVTLKPFSVAEGIVVDENGAPLPGVQVSVGRGRNTYDILTTAADGTFAAKVDANFVKIFAGRDGRRDAGVFVEVKGAAVVPVRLILPEVHDVSGRVVVSGPVDLSTLRVWIQALPINFRDLMTMREAPIDRHGNFSMFLPRGRYALAVGQQAQWDDDPKTEISVEGPVDALRLPYPRTNVPALTVSVHEPDGQPAVGVVVLASSKGVQETDAAGHAIFGRLEKYPVTVFVEQNEKGVGSATVFDASQATVDIDLKAGGRVRGRVAGEHGLLTVMFERGSWPSGTPLLFEGPDFFMNHVAPGRIEVRVIGEDGLTAVTSVDVEEGKEAVVDCVLDTALTK